MSGTAPQIRIQPLQTATLLIAHQLGISSGVGVFGVLTRLPPGIKKPRIGEVFYFIGLSAR